MKLSRDPLFIDQVREHQARCASFGTWPLYRMVDPSTFHMTRRLPDQ
jgi:hypothetical protein